MPSTVSKRRLYCTPYCSVSFVSTILSQKTTGLRPYLTLILKSMASQFGGTGKRSDHYANMSVQYTAIFHSCKNLNFQLKKCVIFLTFAQNIDCWYTEAVLTSTHNQCFKSKSKKKVYPSKPQFYYIKAVCILYGHVSMIRRIIQFLIRSGSSLFAYRIFH